MSEGFRSEEARVFWRYTESSISRLIALAVECPSDVVRWAPPADAANSILALANHTLANAEENILGVILAQPVTREREEEFDGDAVSVALVARRWDSLRAAASEGVATLSPQDLGRVATHPRRGAIAVREVLLVVARHAAEHLGQAELTRDLAVAALSRR